MLVLIKVGLQTGASEGKRLTHTPVDTDQVHVIPCFVTSRRARAKRIFESLPHPRWNDQSCTDGLTPTCGGSRNKAWGPKVLTLTLIVLLAGH